MNERINITMPADLLARIDEGAAAEHLTRSGYLRAAALERLEGRSPGSGLHGADVFGEPVATYGGGAPSMAGRTAASAATPAWPPTPGQAAALLRGFFAARDDVDVAYLVGSVARGEAGPRSDIDVAVLLEEAMAQPQRWDAQLDLMSRIGLAFRTNDVDVIVLNDAPVEVAHSALLDGIVVAGEHRPNRPAFEAQIHDRFTAGAPEREARHAALRKRILSGGFFDR